MQLTVKHIIYPKRIVANFRFTAYILLLQLVSLFVFTPASAQDDKVYDYSTGEPLPTQQDTIKTNSPENEVERSYPLMVFEAGLGAGISVGSELREVFDFGNGVEIALSFNVLSNNKLSVAPIFQLNFLNNYYSETTQDNLIWWGFGAKSNYYLLDRNKGVWNFYPSASIKYNRINNYLSPRPGYSGNVIDVLKGGGLSYTVGFGVVRRLNYLQIDYQIFNPMTKVDKGIIEDYNSNTGLYQPYQFNKTRMNFNYIGLTLGMHMPIKRNR